MAETKSQIHADGNAPASVCDLNVGETVMNNSTTNILLACILAVQVWGVDYFKDGMTIGLVILIGCACLYAASVAIGNLLGWLRTLIIKIDAYCGK
jgi:hypothetical protein